MDRFIKKTAIPFSGYVYQTLIGINLLWEWLEHPLRFEWVVFESDQDDIPTGLDDIIAKRAEDGKLLCWQVKFTVDPDNSANLLSWDWLLQHKPKGRSLIQKWSDALIALGIDAVGDAALVTNRKPDREFEACLDSGKVVLERLPDAVQVQVVAQLGDAKHAVAFFSQFTFNHSYKGYDVLERVLLDRFVPKHTDDRGWYALRNYAQDWATKVDCPPPSGKITLAVLRRLLSTRRPKPLPQSFFVPEGYVPPDEEFDRRFISEVADSSKRVIVLWGMPGQGKSTYLSHLCSKFTISKAPFIRHHYFLHLADPSDRFSLTEVANSLMHQMEERQGEFVRGMDASPEHLREWIERCGEKYAAEGKRFVVVVDGLDHVWRENDRDKGPLESLFAHLLPVPENVVLILGTQKVSESQLPRKLPYFTAEADWIELPSMSLTAIKTWLGIQAKAGRFSLSKKSLPNEPRPLTALAKAFLDLTGGHPLHLTYSLEAAIQRGSLLTPAQIEDLPACPDGDIRRYYRSLWTRLSTTAQDALHLVTGCDFIWPFAGFEQCLGEKAGTLPGEIGHLLHLTEAGYIPFHGSLPAFVAEQRDHPGRLSILRPNVASWLTSKAPVYLRWGWLWLVKAQVGSQDDLVNGPSRDWIISSLCEGFPTSQIMEILSAAELVAFRRKDYPRAVQLRWLKRRLENGREFQLDDYDRVYERALALGTDDYPIRNLSAGFHIASTAQLRLLGRLYLLQGRRASVVACHEQIRKRINDRLQSRALDTSALRYAMEAYLELIAATGSFSTEKLVHNLRQFKSIGDGLFQFFLHELAKNQDPAQLASFVSTNLSARMRQDLELNLVRLAGACKAQLADWPEFESLEHHPIVQIWAYLYARERFRVPAYSLDVSGFDVAGVHDDTVDGVKRFLHGLFFYLLSECLQCGGADPVITLPKFEKREGLNASLHLIVKLSLAVGAALARAQYPDFTFCYRLVADVQVPRDHEQFRDYVVFRDALLEIASDIVLLVSIKRDISQIGAGEWRMVSASPHFVFSIWRDRYVETKSRLVSESVVEDEIIRRLVEEERRITQFNDRTQFYLELCELAAIQNLEGIGRKLLRKVIECIMGYGWRKDISLFHVLDAIEAIAEVDEAAAKTWISKLCPMVEQINELTDGDETRHSKSVLASLLVRYMPASYAGYYEESLKSSEWYDGDRLFAELLEHADLQSDAGTFVTSSVWDSYGVAALQKRNSQGESYCGAIIERNAKFYGLPEDDLGKERSYSSSSTSEDVQFNATAYAPNMLSQLVTDLHAKRIYTGESKAIRAWFDHWKQQGQIRHVLASLETFREAGDIPSGAAELLDAVFLESLHLEGKAKAYRWIVAAQIHGHGWSEYYSEDKALNRFRLFAQHYRDRWQEFIADTATSPFKKFGEQLVIAHNRLVRFLLEVDQVEIAIAVTEAMVSTTLEEMADQPLKRPIWLTGG